NGPHNRAAFEKKIDGDVGEGESGHGNQRI
ncbi:MAG: hypothetical protein JWO94_4024, partial [Verrucomicrobiaceae bacterium]|nr:hypothetical protein [Verrucomicrobiaceae bacterium]